MTKPLYDYYESDNGLGPSQNELAGLHYYGSVSHGELALKYKNYEN